MKLILRPVHYPAILPIDFRAEASLSDLRRTVARLTQSPATPASAIHLSLNGSDDLPASSDAQSLAALGFASDDVVFYSLSEFDPAVPPVMIKGTIVEDSDSDHVSIDYDSSEEVSEDDPEICGGGSCGFPESFERRLSRALRLLGEPRESRYEGFETGLLILSVHCVLLESGFVRFDSASGKKIDDEVDVVGSSTALLNYTLPAILEKEDERPFVFVKFSNMKPYFIVFAGLNNGGSDSAMYRLCLGHSRFSKAIRTVAGVGIWAPEYVKDLSELWTMVRDEVALPLMIDLCAKAGIPGPPCLMSLPPELQVRILKLLPVDDISRATCTCKELYNLASNIELLPKNRKSDLKDAFKASWLIKKRGKEEVEPAARTRRASRAWPAYGMGLILPDPFYEMGWARINAGSLLTPGMFLPPRFRLPSQNLGGPFRL